MWLQSPRLLRPFSNITREVATREYQVSTPPYTDIDTVTLSMCVCVWPGWQGAAPHQL